MVGSSLALPSEEDGMMQHDIAESLSAHRMISCRSSLTLENPQLLRGTLSSVILGRFGQRLRNTSGCEAAANEHKHSFQVHQLDIFLSHSWHAPWRVKYISLLLYFNAVPAFIAAMIGAIVFAPHVKAFVESNNLFDGSCLRHFVMIKKEGDVRHMSGGLFLSFYIGSIACFTVLLSWHQVRRFCRRNQTVFLDKVCIHQTDASLKTQGIRSIGAFIDKSKQLLIAWDATYFERLWCAFELAAFKYRRPRGDIAFRPSMLGAAVASYSFMSFSIELLRTLVVMLSDRILGRPLSLREFVLTWHLFFPVANFLFVRIARRYARDLVLLKEQLHTFSASRAQCFCCSAAHVHPTTGLPLLCDRELVFASIAHWHGNDDVDVGLERFDRLVREELSKDIWQLRGLAQIPYEEALLASLWNGLMWVDIWWPNVHDGLILAKAMELMQEVFLIYPALLGMIFFLSMQFPASSARDMSTLPTSARVYHIVGEESTNIAISLSTYSVEAFRLFYVCPIPEISFRYVRKRTVYRIFYGICFLLILAFYYSHVIFRVKRRVKRICMFFSTATKNARARAELELT